MQCTNGVLFVSKLHFYDGYTIAITLYIMVRIYKSGLNTFTSLVPRPLSVLSCSRGEKLGEGLVSILRHRPEMVDSIVT